MKILFLDIDGVINSHRSCLVNDSYPFSFEEKDMAKFDDIAVRMIRKVLEETGAVVVVSSTWRNYFTPEEIAEGLRIPVLDRTPNFGRIRGDEVKKWLDVHAEKHGVTKYAIIDDNSDFLEEQKPFFVQTDLYDGMTFHNYLQLKNLLSDEEPVPLPGYGPHGED